MFSQIIHVIGAIVIDLFTNLVEKKLLLALLSIKSSSGSENGSRGQQITPEVLNEAFSAKSTQCSS